MTSHRAVRSVRTGRAPLLAAAVLLPLAIGACDWIQYAGFGGRPRAPEPFGGQGALDPPPQDGVYHPGAVDVQPRLIACRHDPPSGAGARVRVNVRLTVQATGTPSDISVSSVQGTDDPDVAETFRQLALQVAATCRYRPGELRGRPVAVRWSERFEFLRDAS